MDTFGQFPYGDGVGNFRIGAAAMALELEMELEAEADAVVSVLLRGRLKDIGGP